MMCFLFGQERIRRALHCSQAAAACRQDSAVIHFGSGAVSQVDGDRCMPSHADDHP
jgi:hypothetical protein